MNLRSTLAILVVPFLTLAACAAPAEDDAAGNADSASTVASRWRSPLTVGDYESDDGELVVCNDVIEAVTSQLVSVSDKVGAERQSCDLATVDVTGGKASIQDGLCKLSLTPQGADAIEASGTLKTTALRDTFTRRPANAAVGKYAQTLASGAMAELEIEASSADALTLSYRKDGVDVVSHVIAKRVQPCLTAWDTAIEGCVYTIGFFRSKGKFIPEMYPSVTKNSTMNACVDRW